MFAVPDPGGRHLSREELVVVARGIQNAQDRGEDFSVLMGIFKANVPCPDVENLFFTDQSPEYIVDFCLGWKDNHRQYSREELIDIVRRILMGQGTEAELHLLIAAFRAACRHPAKSELLFYPDAHFGGKADPTPEEIVAKALGG